ncbi:eukaryotic translation initiation factor 4G-like isoform X1 [Arachis stenosperma]|uniref:eukaryotic translation initiation factor 4G-like isoform X1 n=1 Tax=Arachis stenosperma TaxID=217475 RepID=UPI0025AD0899|nr:eukaryotic translation initiation factor 4G-like isoform X1 [Arachis stenosperma]XP_057733473.1 eukaryotic translation initiation factor 4G-like isoform X1 [Arachis stenosperma]XP_057733474.1 eukaryotic translation initiation factor 4G-like isoform X1 [Arachis stenosperma]XP_057733475.1 eukaryotic translation initiation factor 4G-like isoform X1 [Arachis stenosperma]
MSFNQSKTNRSTAVYRKSERSTSFNQQQGSSFAYGGGGIKPTPSIPSSPSLSSNQRFNKKSSDAQVGQSRVNPTPLNVIESNSGSAARNIQNGAHVQPQLHGASDAPATTKPCESSAVQGSTVTIPKVPSSQLPPATSDPITPETPTKGDASKSFPFQFGSINPSIMNGMTGPTSISSARPNIDEQKQDQASVPTSLIPKQQLSPRKDASVIEQSIDGETNIQTKAKKDLRVPTATSANQMQNPSIIPITGISNSTPYHLSRASLQFGSSNPHIQSQGLPTTSLQMPIQMALPIGNTTQVQQPIFIPSLQPRPMQPQGIMNQGQNMTFTPQMGHQLSHQLGNVGISMIQQYPQQHGQKYQPGLRKTTHVKITHPETHEELRLDKRANAYSDGSSNSRSHPNIPSQSQPGQSFAAYPMNYYSPNSYSTNSLYYHPPNPLPLTSSQNTANLQPQRFNYPLNHGSQHVGFLNSMQHSSLFANKTGASILGSVEPPILENFHDIPNLMSLTGAAPVTIRPCDASDVVDTSLSNSGNSGVQNREPNISVASCDSGSPALQNVSETSPEISSQQSKLFGNSFVQQKQSPGSVFVSIEKLAATPLSQPSSVMTEDHASLVSRRKETLTRSNSLKENPKKLEKSAQSRHQAVSIQSPSMDNVAYQAIDNDMQSVDILETTSNHVKNSSDTFCNDSLSFLTSSANDKPISEPNKVKATSKGNKKRREILRKANAAGSTSDLYNAYKGPKEKKETVFSSESTNNASSSESLKQVSTDAAHLDLKVSEKCQESKVEPDDWEDAADMCTSKLEVDDKFQLISDVNRGVAKRYSRDFLLKFAEQCTDLPEGFQITVDIAEALMSFTIVDRPSGMPWMDYCGTGVNEEERWSKSSNTFHSGRRGLDVGGGNVGFRSGPGNNFGALRNFRGETPIQYAGAGVLYGPTQSMGIPSGMQRNSNGERWQRSVSFQHKGLIHSRTPQTPLQTMHKAERKYEVGKVSDIEEAKQRQLKAILNKLTPQNFERLFEQVKVVNIDNAITLTGVISQIFEKALMEPTFCEMYANFCLHLASELPDFSEDNEKITFKRLLLNKCQEEFERGEREQEEANKADEGEVKQSDEEREDRRVKARRRMLGNIRLIGELYKKRMLTERIMHECIKKLLGQYQDPDEEDIEALCKLMSTIGDMIDHPKAKKHMDAYFERMKLLSDNMNLSSRVRFMLKDAIDLRENKWQQRRKIEGPKKIEEVHRDAVQERQAQAGRLGRGPSNNQTSRRNPVDFRPRGSLVSSTTAQIGVPHGLPGQVRGLGSQDACSEERQSFEARTLSPRALGDDSITLGPQGSLARGMSIRGSTAIVSSSMPNAIPTSVDSSKATGVLNGYGDLSECAPYLTDRFSGPAAYDQSSALEHNIGLDKKDLSTSYRGLDNLVATSPSDQLQGSIVSQVSSSEKVRSEEQLRDMSMAAIKEYYSARDEKEVALCVKELNSPCFHPSMVCLWVTDSFERKDKERDLLAELLVHLVKSHDGILSQAQLIQGFESVLSTLEDAVNDAPKAPEFLGRLFAKVIIESVFSLNEIERLLRDGGEEPGSLLETGLAADVLGSTLEVIKFEKGDAILRDICVGSNLQLETFRPPKPTTSIKLERFI